MILHNHIRYIGRTLQLGERVVSAVSNPTFSLNRLLAAAGASQLAGPRAVSPSQPAEPSQEVSGLPVGKSELTDEERQQVEQLQKRDTEVRRHEQAHKAAAGQYARGGASFETQTGPDGRSYAVGGEVSIDTSPIEGDPQATIRKMQQIQAAALAPAEPSGQDRQVAAQAAQAAQQARAELAQKDADGEPSSGTEQSSTANKSASTLAAHYASAQREQGPNQAGRFIDVAA